MERSQKQSIVRRMMFSASRASGKDKSPCLSLSKDKEEKTAHLEAPSDTDRYYTAGSSGDDYDDIDDVDGGLCIRLDSDDDSGSLSGFQINLETLQAVSSMLAHYIPIIQSDVYGNPRFVPPPPPPDEEYYQKDNRTFQKQPQTTPKRISKRHRSDYSFKSTVPEDEDYHCAIQELEDVLLAQDSPNFTDAMSELTDVMEKMSRFTEELSVE